MKTREERDVLTTCLDLHMNFHGSSDTMTFEEMRASAMRLQRLVNNWVRTLPGARWAAFDTAVLNLVHATLNEYREWSERFPDPKTIKVHTDTKEVG